MIINIPLEKSDIFAVVTDRRCYCSSPGAVPLEGGEGGKSEGGSGGQAHLGCRLQ